MWSFNNNNTDLRNELDSVLKEIHDVYLYLRVDPRYKCPNYSQGNLDAGVCTENCTCYGTGYKVSLEVIPGHMSHGVNIRTLEGFLKEAVGYLKTDKEVLIMPWHIYPEIGDYVCSAEWNLSLVNWTDPQFKPTRILECFKISDVERPNIRGGIWHVAGLNPYQTLITSLQNKIPSMKDLTKRNWE